MKKNNNITTLLVVLGAFLLASCASLHPQKPLQPFAAQNLNPRLRSGELMQKKDNFVVVLDSSGSMADKYKGQVKLDLAKEFVNRMNQAIPDIRLKAGLRKLAGKYDLAASQTDLIYGVTDFKKTKLEGALRTVVLPFGETPLALAIKGASDDLKTTQGPIAAIIVSDGKGTVGNAVKAAKSMKKRFGDRVCIFPVVVGNDPEGQKEMEQIAMEGGCGFSVDEKATRSNIAMANFVERVFLAKVGDQDGDGVLDPSDQCPNTPRGVRVDARGCPVPTQITQAPKKIMDSDGDGVLDNMDICPGTPGGAQVDTSGCWTLHNVRFETSKWDIKPRFYPILDDVVEVLQKNPSLTVQVLGHTDSRGTARYNQGLSENRAKAVTEYLINKGIPKQRLIPLGLGLTNPLASNKSPEGRAKNRRVHLKPNK